MISLRLPGNPFDTSISQFRDKVIEAAHGKAVDAPRVTMHVSYYTRLQPTADLAMWTSELVDALATAGALRATWTVTDLQIRALPAGSGDERVAIVAEPHWASEEPSLWDRGRGRPHG
jgi:hypothetical protein